MTLKTLDLKYKKVSEIGVSECIFEFENKF